MKDTLIYSKQTFNFKGILRSFERPLVMGIINSTPDSFYQNSRIQNLDGLLVRVDKMISEGVDIIDVGGYSSRPGAVDISVDEEILRVVPVIKLIHEKYPELLISIDTFRSKVAAEALAAGASVINDISGGVQDEEIFEVAATNNAPYILMHMKGTPQTMVSLSNYENLINELVLYFSTQIDKAKKAGVKDIILDPGFGFSKNIQQNFELLNQLEQLTLFNLPLLVGISRKSMIYKTLGISPEESLNGTTVLNTIALMKGASVLRVHDVKEAREVLEMVGFLGWV